MPRLRKHTLDTLRPMEMKRPGKEYVDMSHLKRGVSSERWGEIEPVIDKLTDKQKVRLAEQTTDAQPASRELCDADAAFRAINGYGGPAVTAIAKYGYPATLAIADHEGPAMRSINKYGKPAALAIARLGESAAHAIDKHGAAALNLISKYGLTAAMAIDFCGEPAINAIKRHKRDAASAISLIGEPAVKIYLGTRDTKSANKALEKYGQSLKKQ